MTIFSQSVSFENLNIPLELYAVLQNPMSLLSSDFAFNIVIGVNFFTITPESFNIVRETLKILSFPITVDRGVELVDVNFTTGWKALIALLMHDAVLLVN